MHACRKKRREEIAGEQQRNAGHGNDSQKDGNRSVAWIDAGVHGVKGIVKPRRHGVAGSGRIRGEGTAGI